MRTLLLSLKERRRLEVLSRVRDGGMSVAEAARVLEISERQAWRLKSRYAACGDAGLAHALRGRASNRRTDAAARAAILKLYRAKCAGFGPTLACEYLAAEGWFEKRRKRSKHRLHRPRRSCAGELVQMDGSWHDWFEGRGPWCCLMVMVDDATGRALARFYDKETLAAAFEIFGRYAKRHGLPRAVYVDKAGIYRADEGCPLTQFGRAMSDLGVELILANSPHAKGRVERMNGTLQDRLVKDMASANALLDGSFLNAFNGKFTVSAAKKKDMHRRAGSRSKLDEVLCEREERAVGRDWCVQWRGRWLQVDALHAGLDLSRPGRRVTVIQKTKKPVTNNKRYVPGPDHPFNRRPVCPGSRPRLRASSATPPRL